MDSVNNDGTRTTTMAIASDVDGMMSSRRKDNFEDVFFGDGTINTDGGDGTGNDLLSQWYAEANLVPSSFFDDVQFSDLPSPSKLLRMDNGEVERPAPSQQPPAAAVTTSTKPDQRQRSNSAITAVPRDTKKKSNIPNGNWYNLCQKQQQQQQQQQRLSSAMSYTGSSPFMAPVGMDYGATDPYGWMHSGRPKRPVGGAFPTTSPTAYPMVSPPLMYAAPPYASPTANMYAPGQSPQFGLVSPFYMVPPQQHSIPKLPVQALPPRPDHSAMVEADQEPAMAPLILPVDLNKGMRRQDATSDNIDPTAISTAISNALRTGAPAAAESPASSTMSLSPTGIPPAFSNQVDNVRTYEATFKSFIQEESMIDYSNVTVIELKKLLRKYHLAATGKKDDLIKLVKEVSQFLKATTTNSSSTESEGRSKEERKDDTTAEMDSSKNSDTLLTGKMAERPVEKEGPIEEEPTAGNTCDFTNFFEVC